MGPDTSIFQDAHERAFSNHIRRLREAELKGEPLTDRSADEVEKDLLGSVNEEAKQEVRRGRPPKNADDESEG